MGLFLLTLSVVIIWDLIRLGANWQSTVWTNDDPNKTVTGNRNAVWVVDFISVIMLLGLFWALVYVTATAANTGVK